MYNMYSLIAIQSRLTGLDWRRDAFFLNLLPPFRTILHVTINSWETFIKLQLRELDQSIRVLPSPLTLSFSYSRGVSEPYPIAMNSILCAEGA